MSLVENGLEVGPNASGSVPATRTVAGHPLSSDVTLAKGDVGLGNVDNTSDANKPVSTAQAAADAAVLASARASDRYPVGPFSASALAAGAAVAPADSANQFLLFGGSLFTVLRAGSVTGLSAAMNPDPAAGSAVRVRVAVIDGGPPTFYDTLVATIADGDDHAVATVAPGTIPVAAGALVGVVAQTGSGFTATAVPIAASVEITPT